MFEKKYCSNHFRLLYRVQIPLSGNSILLPRSAMLPWDTSRTSRQNQRTTVNEKRPLESVQSKVFPEDTRSQQEDAPADRPSDVSEQTIWDVYETAAIPRDKEMLEECAENLNGLLIYAGLFSAVLTAFIIESIDLLQEDPQEAALAVLIVLSQQLNNSTSPPYTKPDFTAPKYAVVVNSCFFASLICSLLSALAAVLVLQWIKAYGNKLAIPDVKKRVMRRHLRYTGFSRWNMVNIVAALPIILLISVSLFFVGLLVWMWSINVIIGKITLVGGVVGLVLYLFTGLVAAIFHDAPFRSPMSTLLVPVLRLLELFGYILLYPFLLCFTICRVLLNLPFIIYGILCSCFTSTEEKQRIERIISLPCAPRSIFSIVGREEISLSDPALQKQVIEWTCSNVYLRREYLFKVLEYSQAIIKNRDLQSEREIAEALRDASMVLKILTDKCYAYTKYERYDDLDAHIIPLLAVCSVDRRFVDLTYYRADDLRRIGTSGIFGDLSMFDQLTENDLSVVVQLAYWWNNPLSPTFQKLWEELRDNTPRSAQHTFGDNILTYARRRLRIFLITSESEGSEIVNEIAGRGSFDAVLGLDSRTELSPEEVLEICIHASQSPWFVRNVRTGERLWRLLKRFHDVVSVTERHAVLCNALFPLIESHDELEAMLAVVHRHFLGPSVTRRFGEENLNAIRAHLVALQ
ncbi:hypothetical protein FRC14_007830, partial [Serendipita sp. 396]